MLLVSAGVVACGGTDPEADDPELVGRWLGYSRASDLSGIPGCSWASRVLTFRPDQTLVDSTYTIAPGDPHAADSSAVCEGIPFSRAMRQWSVAAAGVLVLVPGQVSVADTLEYAVDGDSLRLSADGLELEVLARGS
jgi:hypothetical protein